MVRRSRTGAAAWPTCGFNPRRTRGLSRRTCLA
jgi:hypothetical protein